MRTIAVLTVSFALAATGCARTTTVRDGSSPEYPLGSALVVRVQTAGGLVPSTDRWRSLPAFTLVGDGRSLTPGPQIELYPPPALPSVSERRITAEGISRILAAAREVGLTKGNRSIASPTPVMDAGETVFTVVADGKTSVTRVDALGVSSETGERGEIAAFRDKLFDLNKWLPAGSVGEEKTYAFDALRVVAAPYEKNAQDSSGIQPQRKDWPLGGSLASFGEALDANFGARCGIVRGADLQKLLPEVKESNSLTRWRSSGSDYVLTVRPTLPDEAAC